MSNMVTYINNLKTKKQKLHGPNQPLANGHISLGSFNHSSRWQPNGYFHFLFFFAKIKNSTQTKQRRFVWVGAKKKVAGQPASRGTRADGCKPVRSLVAFSLLIFRPRADGCTRSNGLFVRSILHKQVASQRRFQQLIGSNRLHWFPIGFECFQIIVELFKTIFNNFFTKL